MNKQLREWKRAVEELWSAAELDYPAAARLISDIARQDGKAFLQEAAAQARPSLRAACLNDAERGARDLARRRLGVVRDALHALTAPRFGRRGIAAEALTPDEQNRQLLGLPAGRRLFGADIHRAYKHAAKTMHPDTGGSEREFLALCAARDALMKVH